MTKNEVLNSHLEKANELYQIAILLDDDRKKKYALKVIASIEKELNS